MEIVEQLSFGSFIDETTPGKIIRAIYNSLPLVSEDDLHLYTASGSAGLVRVQMDAAATIFRPEQLGVTLLSIKENTKEPYARLPKRCIVQLRAVGLPFSPEGTKSDYSFVRVPLEEFLSACAAGTLSGLFTEMLKYSIGAAAFGCCHLCDKCSDAGLCLHEDQLYALVCQYKAHLDAGRVFYGEKKNK